MYFFSKWQRLFGCIQSQKPKNNPNKNFEQEPSHEPVPEDYSTFPPPTPREIIQDPESYWSIVKARKYAAPQAVFEHYSLYAFYRLYEVVLLDKVLAYRNSLEWFWKQLQWPVHEIPDPRDNDPARYAFLAALTYLRVGS